MVKWMERTHQMTELFSRIIRTARKEHICNYCGKKILLGEKYEVSVYKYDGEIYQWKSHEQCAFIAQAIWDYVDPDDGMSDYDFIEGCSDICIEFICPNCSKMDTGECDKRYCPDKLYKLLQEKELYIDKQDGVISYWKLRDR